LKLFEEHGYHGVSVHQIVKESGTSKGGFYHHFQSKEELLYVIHDYFISYVLTKAQEVITTNQSPTEKLQSIIRSFVKVFHLYKPHISVFYQESIYLKAPYIGIIKAKRDEYRNIIFKVVEEGIQHGEFRSELPVEITGMSILGMVNWTYKWYRVDGEKSIEEIADIFTDLILQSLWTDKARQNKAYDRYLIKNVALEK
jgi:AcrR family transcriptional regulator